MYKISGGWYADSSAGPRRKTRIKPFYAVVVQW